MIAISFAVPVSVRVLMLEPLTTASIAVPLNPAKLAGKPSNANVGLPDTPLPFVIDKPSPEAVNVRGSTVVLPVFAMIPFRAFSRLSDAPVRLMRKYDCAPLS
jgi:hypothetical protein